MYLNKLVINYLNLKPDKIPVYAIKRTAFSASRFNHEL